MQTTVHHHWATRPADERPKDPDVLHQVALALRESSTSVAVPTDKIAERLSVHDGAPVLNGTGAVGHFSHASFAQMCALGGIPSPSAWRTPPPAEPLTEILRHGLRERASDTPKLRMLTHTRTDGTVSLRAFNGRRYGYVPHAELTPGILRMVEAGWAQPMAYRVTAPATRPGGWPTMSLDMEPSGLFISDRDMTVLLTREDRPVETGRDRPQFPVVILRNSETGHGSLSLTLGYVDYVCGNLMLWGFAQLAEVRVRHVGRRTLQRALPQIREAYRQALNAPAGATEALISKGRSTRLAATPEDTADVLSRRPFSVPLRTTAQAIARVQVEAPELDPLSHYGVVQGLTYLARDRGNHADAQVDMARQAGRIMDALA